MTKPRTNDRIESHGAGPTASVRMNVGTHLSVMPTTCDRYRSLIQTQPFFFTFNEKFPSRGSQTACNRCGSN
jgi:hypothetical protein